MTSQELIEKLATVPDLDTQKAWLEASRPALDDQVAGYLKDQADRFLRADVRRSLDMAYLLQHLGLLRHDECNQALGLLAEANALALGGLGQYARAVEVYDQAAALYDRHGRSAEQAGSAVGKIFALAMLGQYEEALAAGNQARPILEAHQQWRALANLSMNLAVVHGRQRDDERALAEFEQTRALCLRLGAEGERLLPLVEQDRAIVLRNLGRFQASIAANKHALKLLERTNQQAETGHVQQNLAATYVMLGRFNEALALLDQARDTFLADGRPVDAIETDLVTSYCLLQLRRFDDALEKCRDVRGFCRQVGRQREVAETWLNEAVAQIGLRRIDLAFQALNDARALFEAEGNVVWINRVDIERAALLEVQGQPSESLALAMQCVEEFEQRKLPVQQAQAALVAARAALALNQHALARTLARQALTTADQQHLAELAHQSHAILAADAEAQENRQEARQHYELAIQALEQLRGRAMVEHRAGFLEDKQSLYQHALRLSLELNDPGRGLEYAERAKSRALVDMLAFKLDLGLTARKPGDAGIVAELEQLREQRDRLYRRWQGSADQTRNAWTVGDAPQPLSGDVVALEGRMTQLWHKLLVRNADYARDVTLWQVHTEPFQSSLDDKTAVLEYFVTDADIVAFVVTKSTVTATRLSLTENSVRRSLRRLQLNFATVPASQIAQIPGLAGNALGILNQLYNQLIAPVVQQLIGFQRLVVVPHGALHYLPFQALFDGERYLVERFELSRLPVASLLRFCCDQPRTGSGVLALGNSFGGRLPHAVDEAQQVAELCSGDLFMEEDATPDALRASASNKRVLHMAVHGDFRPDNPLFSGLALAKGWLTTLDIFSLRLNASLVTLSACQTGQHVVGGGDELLGLMRAFFAAGASSLVLSQWSVEDRSTAELMTAFYQHLTRGATKGDALRQAQLQFIRGQIAPELPADAYTHPYFWAPFFLVGDGGSI